jgi:hypothetical protein
MTGMTPSSDSCSGYDSFWTAVETLPTRNLPDSSDAYAAFFAAVDE